MADDVVFGRRGVRWPARGAGERAEERHRETEPVVVVWFATAVLPSHRLMRVVCVRERE